LTIVIHGGRFRALVRKALEGVPFRQQQHPIARETRGGVAQSARSRRLWPALGAAALLLAPASAALSQWREDVA
jgi:hypothetical protein